MGRPQKEYKVKRNGDSLQVYHEGAYIGSIRLERLAYLMKAEKSKSTT